MEIYVFNDALIQNKHIYSQNVTSYNNIFHTLTILQIEKSSSRQLPCHNIYAALTRFELVEIPRKSFNSRMHFVHITAYYYTTLQHVVNLCAKIYYAAFPRSLLITLLTSIVKTQPSIILLIFCKKSQTTYIEISICSFIPSLLKILLTRI